MDQNDNCGTQTVVEAVNVCNEKMAARQKQNIKNDRGNRY